MLLLVERLRKSWAELRLGLRVILALIFLGLIVLALAKPLRTGVRQYSLDRNTRLATAALQAGDPTEARSRSLAAIQSAPDRIDILRLILKSMDALNDPQRLDAATYLFNHPQGTPADKQLAFEVLTRNAALTTVGTAWARLTPAEQADPAMIDSFGRRLLTEGKTDQAALMLKGLDLENPPERIAAFVIDLLAAKGGEDAWLEIQKRLIRRTQTATAAGEPIPVWCLAAWERVPQALLDPAALAQLPESGPQRLAMLRRRLTQGERPLDPADPQIAGWLQNSVDTDRLPLARLLAHCGLQETAIRSVERAPGIRPDEYEWLREIRQRTGDWREWRNFLESDAVARLPQARVKADLAVALMQLAEPDQATTAWTAAMQSAASAPGDFRLPDLSRRVRESMPARSQEAMLAAIHARSEALPLFSDLDGLMSFLLKARRDRDLLDVCRAYRDIEQGNPVPAVRYAYLALLAEELSPTGALQLVAPVIALQPKSPHPRIIAIMAALLQGDRTAALGWIARGQADWSQSPPFYQWVLDRAEDPDFDSAPPSADKLLPFESAAVKRLARP